MWHDKVQNQVEIHYQEEIWANYGHKSQVSTGERFFFCKAQFSYGSKRKYVRKYEFVQKCKKASS